jgi:serine phosphatase RsbU (regulator of sigma subunit)
MHDRLLKRQRIEQDLQFARRVQQSFLPQHAPELEGFIFKDWYRSAQEVGGDFYDFIRPSKDRLAIVIGDVAGKGVPAALLMAKISSDLRYFALAESEPKAVLARVNEKFSEGQAEDIFVTVLYLLLLIDQKKIIIGNAGHLPPVVRSGSNRQVKKIESAVNYPIGVLTGATFEQEEYQLESGDAVAIFTDGVIEAMDKDHNQYGFQRLETAMAANLPDATSLGQNVLEDVRRFVGNTPQSDDLTLVCFGTK